MKPKIHFYNNVSAYRLFFDRAANLQQSSKAKIDRYKNVKFAAKSKLAVLQSGANFTQVTF
jgi:hypothetical protein